MIRSSRERENGRTGGRENGRTGEQEDGKRGVPLHRHPAVHAQDVAGAPPRLAVVPDEHRSGRAGVRRVGRRRPFAILLEVRHVHASGETAGLHGHDAAPPLRRRRRLAPSSRRGTLTSFPRRRACPRPRGRPAYPPRCRDGASARWRCPACRLRRCPACRLRRCSAAESRRLVRRRLVDASQVQPHACPAVRLPQHISGAFGRGTGGVGPPQLVLDGRTPVDAFRQGHPEFPCGRRSLALRRI